MKKRKQFKNHLYDELVFRLSTGFYLQLSKNLDNQLWGQLVDHLYLRLRYDLREQLRETYETT